jgi:hypothetical protein
LRNEFGTQPYSTICCNSSIRKNQMNGNQITALLFVAMMFLAIFALAS